MATPRLFHGPSARDEAVRAAAEAGRPIADPVGDAGLKVSDSRAVVDLVVGGAIGDAVPTLVVGPMDGATPEASDALLKTLEDLTEGPVVLSLWADWVGGVVPTIRSRVSEVWCPAVAGTLDPLSPFLQAGASAAGCAMSGAVGDAIGIVIEHEGTEGELLRAAARALTPHIQSEDTDVAEKALIVWRRIRLALRRPTRLSAMRALIGGSS